MSIEKLEKSTVDRCRIDSLLYFYFGNTDNPLMAASHRAYLDMCRTLRKADGVILTDVKAKGQQILEREVKTILKSCRSKAEYNDWHMNVCNRLLELYAGENIQLYVGQAQKWINMTMKYLYILTGDELKNIFDYLHIPLDNYVYSAAKKRLGISAPKKRWSRIDSYEEYMELQVKIWGAIDGQSPIEWEIFNWMEEAKI